MIVMSWCGFLRKAQRRCRFLCVGGVVAGVMLACLACGAGVASAARIHLLTGSFGAAGTSPADPYPLVAPSDVAIDQASGDVYVADPRAHRVEKFNAAGDFLLMFGKEVNKKKVEEHASEAEQDVCAAGEECQEGTAGSAPGAFEGLFGGASGTENARLFLAVDNSTGPSAGDVYVGDPGDSVVSKFTAGGALVSGWGVDGQLNGSTAVEGPFSGPEGKRVAGVAVDASGDLWVTRTPGESFGHAFEFGQEGSAKASFIPEHEPAINAMGLAVDGLEHLYFGTSALMRMSLAGLGTAEFREGEAYVKEKEVTIIKQTQVQVAGLGVEPLTNDLYVSRLNGGGVDEFAFDALGEVVEPGGSACSEAPLTPIPVFFCAPSEAFGVRNVVDGEGVAVSGAEVGGPVYVADAGAGRVDVFGLRTVPDVVTKGASGFTSSTGVLTGTVDPDGVELASGLQGCRFQWGTTEAYGHEVACGQSASVIGKGSVPVEVSAEITGLAPDTTYHYRLLAANANNVSEPSTGSDRSFGPPVVEAGSTNVIKVTSSSAKFGAEIDPDGIATEYHVEYGPEGGMMESTAEMGVGDGEGVVAVSVPVEGLVASTVYDYRVVTTDAVGTVVDGPVLSFVTQGPGGSLLLPDDRAWEMVSPVEKNGGNVDMPNQGPYLPLLIAAEDGDEVTYGSPQAFPGAISSPTGNQYLAVRRGPDDWVSESLNIPANVENYETLADPPYKAFSTDLSSALVSNGNRTESNSIPPEPLPGTEAQPGIGQFYVRDDGTGGYTAVAREGSGVSLPLNLDDVTPDLKHIVFSSGKSAVGNLYEWSEDNGFEAINYFPGQTQPTSAYVTMGGGGGFKAEGSVKINDPRALSSNGSDVVWRDVTTGDMYLRENVGQEQGPHGECVEAELACTVQVDASQGGHDGSGGGDLLAASADDSRLYFADRKALTAQASASSRTGQLGDLYLFESGAPEGHRLTDITVDHNSSDPEGAEVLGVMGASEDGSYVYFVANGVLAENTGADGSRATHGDCAAQAGAEPSGATCNLYVYHEETVTFLATLSGQDNQGDEEEEPAGTAPDDWKEVEAVRSTRVSADGRVLLFMSRRSLTGYDSTVATGNHCGEDVDLKPYPARCAELFRYEAPASGGGVGRVVCLSCNPTGERPLGSSGIPNGPFIGHEVGYYQSRAMSSDGSRVFFDSYDDLVPQDSNGQLDVYEWEMVGHGTCQVSSETYVGSAGGCVSLISGGRSSEPSDFADASANGSDVFFVTAESLSPRDPGSYDLYDAREGGVAEEAPVAPASCESDNCHPGVSPPLMNAPASSTFTGVGDVATTILRGSSAAKHAPGVGATVKTRAQKLAVALRACRRVRSRVKRRSCEASARKRYAVVGGRPRRAAKKAGRVK